MVHIFHIQTYWGRRQSHNRYHILRNKQLFFLYCAKCSLHFVFQLRAVYALWKTTLYVKIHFSPRREQTHWDFIIRFGLILANNFWSVVLLGVTAVETSWNVMTHGDAREGKWKGNWRMEWIAITLNTTSEHAVSNITTTDAHTSAANSRLNWCPRRFKWTRPFRRKTKFGFCACATTFQTQSTTGALFCPTDVIRHLTSDYRIQRRWPGQPTRALSRKKSFVLYSYVGINSPRARISSNKMHCRQDKNTQNTPANYGESGGNWCEIGDTCKKNVGSTSAGNGASCLHHQHEFATKLLPFSTNETTVFHTVCDTDPEAKLDFLYRYAHAWWKRKSHSPFCSEMNLNLISVDNGIRMVVGIGL
jgi:hypothetical protein